MNRRLGLSLSGGGYRAAAFHLGTLKKLHEMDILRKVDVLSTISGGSITGAAWALHGGDYNSFHNEMLAKIRNRNVIGYVLTSWRFILPALFSLLCIGGSLYLTCTRWSAFAFPLLIAFLLLLYYFQFRLFPISTMVEKAYNSFFFRKKTLKDLPERPLLAIGSSNLETGRPFTFSRKKMSDSSYAYRAEYNPPITFKQDDFPVARAVMASSCVPFAFTPVVIDRQFYTVGSDYNRIKPMLVDGGVYDNQGIQKLTQSKSSYECDIIITSDAGGNFRADKEYPNTIALMVRTLNLFMYRIKAFQMVQNIYRNVEGAGKPIAYLSLGWRIANAIPGFVNNMVTGQVLKEVIDAHGFDPAWVNDPQKYRDEITARLRSNVGYDAIEKRDLTDAQWEIAATTPTNLTCLSEQQSSYLIRQAENFTELQVKLYCPMLLNNTDKWLGIS